MEMMKHLLKAKGLNPTTLLPDVRWGGEHEARFVWVLRTSGVSGAFA